MSADNPFPELSYDAKLKQWTGSLTLSEMDRWTIKWAWGHDRFLPKNGTPKTVGPASVFVSDADGTGPDLRQRAAMVYVLENETRLAAVLLDALTALFDEAKPYLTGTHGWRNTEMDLRDRFLRTLTERRRITELLLHSGLIVYKRSLNERSYTGFTFEKGWDWEHDLIVILHEDRIIDCGDHGSLCNFEEDEGYENEGEPVYGYYC